MPKRAPDEGIFQATASYLGTSQFGGHLDFGERFGSSGSFGLRFNGVYSDGNGPVRDNSDRRGLALLGADFRGDTVRLSADLGYQYRKIDGVISYIALNDGVAVPRPPSGRINQGQPWGYNEYTDVFGTARLEIDLSDHITAFAAFGAHNSRFGSLYSSIITVLDSAGNGRAGSPSDIEYETPGWTGTAGVRGEFQTGSIDHQIAITGTIYGDRTDQGFLRKTGQFTTNIYQPVITPRPVIADPVLGKISSTSKSSVGFADTLSLADRRVQLTLGGRWQQTGSKNFSSGTLYAQYDKSAFSPAVALLVKPWHNVSVYANYIQGLQSGTVVGPQYANAGQVFPPYKTKQYEIGVKVDLGVFTATADVFQIAQPSLITDVPTNRLLLDGEQRNRGLEVNLFGEPVKGLRILGGVMLLDARLSKTQGGANDGWRAPNSPEMNFNLSGEWDLPFVPGLTVNGRVVHTSQLYIDRQLPRRTLSDWTRVDLGVRQRVSNPLATGKDLTFRLNVENVAGARYWAAGGNYLVPGAPRTVRLSVTADF